MEDNTINEEQIKEYFVDLTKAKYVPRLIYNDPNTNKVFTQQGLEIGKLKYYIDDLINNCFIETATWSLDIWEYEYGVISKDTDTIEIRRNRLLAKKKASGTITPKVIKNICNSFVDNTKIIQHYEDYYFELLLENINKGFQNFLEELIQIIEEIKPAHLEVFYKLIQTTQSNLYIGSVICNSEIITVYPWTSNDIEAQTNVYVPISNSTTLETIMIYPKEDETIFYTTDDNGNYVSLEFK